MTMIMRKIALVLAGLTVQIRCSESRRSGSGPHESSEALSKLLLTVNPSTGWQASNFGRSDARSIRAGQRAAVRMPIDEEYNGPQRLPPEEEERLNKIGYAKQKEAQAALKQTRGGPSFDDLLGPQDISYSGNPQDIMQARAAKVPGSGYGEQPLLPNKQYLTQTVDAFGKLDRGAFITTAVVLLSPFVVYFPVKDKIDESLAEAAKTIKEEPGYGGYDASQKLYWTEGKVGKLGYNISMIPQAELIEKAGKLTDFQRQVAFNAVEEQPYTGKTTNGYAWNDKTPGYYLGALSGTPLFSAKAKYDNKDGMLSFIAPCAYDQLVVRGDPKARTGALLRSEVIDVRSGAHVGYLYDDGPKEEEGGFGKRFSIAAAALTFVPTEEGAKAPYGPL